MKSMILRYGAYGDLIYMLPIIDRMKADGKDLYLHTGIRGMDVFREDTRFTSVLVSNPATAEQMQEVIEKDILAVNPDEIVNLSDTMETSLIPTRDQDSFHWPVEKRRKFTRGESFYSMGLQVAGYDRGQGCGTVVYAEEELAWADRWRETHRDEFIVMMTVSGSNAQKRFPFARELGRNILDRYPDAILYLMGGEKEKAKKFSFGDHRTYPVFDIAFRQALLMTRYADYVVGPETGLMVAAGMWGTPKTMLCTSSSVFQCTDGQKNDFSLQADISCSPCLRAIYLPEDCYHPHVAEDETVCNRRFTQETILESIDLVYRTMRYRRDADEECRTQPVRVPGMRPDNVRLPEERGDLQREVPRTL